MGYERRIKGIFKVGGKCEECGWDKHVEIIERHHVYKDGQRTKKIRYLCPNCHKWQTYLDNTSNKIRNATHDFIREWRMRVIK